MQEDKLLISLKKNMKNYDKHTGRNRR